MMTTLNQHGMGLLLAMMIAQGAANEAPAEMASGPAAARPVLIAAGEEDTFGAPSKSGAPAKGAEAAESAFRRLPADDQRIARALLEAEQVGAGSSPAWSLDKIASARASGKDWESIVTEMQTRSLVAAGELDDVLYPRAGRLALWDPVLLDSEQFATGLAVANGPPVEKPQAKKAKISQTAAVKPISKTRVKATEVAEIPGAAAGSGCDAASAATEAELGAGTMAPGTMAPGTMAKAK